MKSRRRGDLPSAAFSFAAFAFAAFSLMFAVVVAACGSSASPTPSPSAVDGPGASSGASASPADSPAASTAASADVSPSPDASPGIGASPSPGAGASISPSPGTPVRPSQGPVTTPEQAAALVLASDPRFAAIGPFDPDLIGQSAWYTVELASGGWIVVVQIGWGDCPAGCIEKHTWTYLVSRSGTVKLVSETGSSIPSDVIPAG